MTSSQYTKGFCWKDLTGLSEFGNLMFVLKLNNALLLGYGVLKCVLNIGRNPECPDLS